VFLAAVKNAWPHYDEVEGLTNLQTLQLEVLCLTRAGVTDSILSSLSRMTALRQLHVPASLVTNQGLEALATLTTLQDLDVSCPRVSTAASPCACTHIHGLTVLTWLVCCHPAPKPTHVGMPPCSRTSTTRSATRERPTWRRCAT
jgi:hypothetical protein